VLSKKEYLVGEKATVADLSFVTWNDILPPLLGDDFDFDKEFPNTARRVTLISRSWQYVYSYLMTRSRWHKKLLDRDSVKKVLEIRDSFAA
jgi:glutathione S-transferase